MATKEPHRETQVIAVSLVKTGTYSMHLALKSLGYENVYHCLNVLYQPEHWKQYGEASDALFPNIPTYNGKGMTKEEWERRLFGPYDVICDIACPFAESLIDCYPDAKFILVTRDFDKWQKSMTMLLDQTFGTVTSLIRDWVEPFIGTTYSTSIQKTFFGWSKKSSVEEMKANLRDIYDSHQAMVRAKVPKDRLLEYRMGDGWEPLCEFLGKEVPDEEFPWGNEEKEFKKIMWDKKVHTVVEAGKQSWPFVVAGGVLVYSAYVGWRL